MNNFLELELNRLGYRNQMADRDGFTPDQQIAMATIHNQEVAGGSTRALLVIIQTPTLKALLSKGAIDAEGRLTKFGNDALKGWWKSARRKAQ